MKRKISFRKGFNIILIINLIVILSIFIFNNLISELKFYYNILFWIILAVNIILIIILNKFKYKKYTEDIILFLLLFYLIISFWVPVCSQGEIGATETKTSIEIPYGYNKSFNCYNICIDETHIK